MLWDCEYCKGEYDLKTEKENHLTLCKYNPTRNIDTQKCQSIAKKHHVETCVACDADRHLEVHNVNEDYSDNRKENLVFLCHYHNGLFHSRFRSEVEPYIVEYVAKRWK